MLETPTLLIFRYGSKTKGKRQKGIFFGNWENESHKPQRSLQKGNYSLKAMSRYLLLSFY